MNHKVLKAYGILKSYDLKVDQYEFARRTTFVIDKQGVIQHIVQDNSAVDPASAVDICLDLHKKSGQ